MSKRAQFALLVAAGMLSLSNRAAVAGFPFPLESNALVVKYQDCNLPPSYFATPVLQGIGMNVDVVCVDTFNPFATPVADALNSGTDYDQVWIHDLPPIPINDLDLVHDDDVAALAAWHASHPSVVFYGASLGIQQNEGGAAHQWVENTAFWFDQNGGGLYFGTNRSPDNSRNVNDYLDDMGYDPVFGYDGVVGVDGGPSPYNNVFNYPNTMTGPEALHWTFGSPARWDASRVPHGLQPNGKNLEPWLWNNADSDAVYISGQFVPIPEPGTACLFGIGLIGLMRRRRRC